MAGRGLISTQGELEPCYAGNIGALTSCLPARKQGNPRYISTTSTSVSLLCRQTGQNAEFVECAGIGQYELDNAPQLIYSKIVPLLSGAFEFVPGEPFLLKMVKVGSQ